jgi:hypothetical protein
LTVEVGVAQERASRAGEREHGQWNWNRHVDADLANIDLMSELSGRGSVGGENGGSFSNHIYIK